MQNIYNVYRINTFGIVLKAEFKNKEIAEEFYGAMVKDHPNNTIRLTLVQEKILSKHIVKN